ncbi:MAG: hypothetical protein INR71_04035 [Terriglobus roseus]|nr:hypothetical protein [Terriglobus roseus]
MAKKPEDDHQDDEGWGTSKADYYDADAIETEQDALDEEAEARRLQQKHLSNLTEDDFGLDDLDEGDAEEDSGLSGRENRDNKVPRMSIPHELASPEDIQQVMSFYPEFGGLRSEFLRIRHLWEKIRTSAKPQGGSQLLVWLLSQTYVGLMAMYFVRLTSEAANEADDTLWIDAGAAADAKPSAPKTATILPPHQVRTHPIIPRLARCKQMWDKLKSMGTLDTFDAETQAEIEHSHGVLESLTSIQLAPGYTAESLAETPAETPGEVPASQKPKRRKSRAERAAEATAAAAEQARQTRIRATEKELDAITTQLQRPTARSKAPALPSAAAASDSDFGEEDALAPDEAAEKARRRKSLRFYTSQIAQKAGQRERRGLMAGGDDDIPRRERFRDRQARSMRATGEAELSAKRGGDADDGADDGDSVDNDLAGGLLRPAKRRKGTDADAGAGGEPGKRKIGYEMEKNKGLTPFRKKEVRNPRVKKRMRYEDRKKKLGSKKAVYRGGEGRGGYGGERTGINANVVKSVKLS